MYYVDNNSGSPTMPALSPAQSNIPTWFTEGDRNKGISWIGQDWLNILQAELLNILSEAGIKPDKGKLNQITLSIKAIITANAYTQANNLKEILDAGIAAQAAARGHLGLGKLATKDSLGPADVNALAKDKNLSDLPNLSLALKNLTLADVKKYVESTHIGLSKLSTFLPTSEGELDALPVGFIGECKNKTPGGPLPTEKWCYIQKTGNLDNRADNPNRKGGTIRLTCIYDAGEVWTGAKFDDGTTTTEKYVWAREYNTLNKPRPADIGALDKNQNGADIPDKPGFIKNVGLTETVNKAAGAMQKSANGGDIQDVAAFRNALQLGTAALASMGTGKGQVLSASHFTFFAGGNGYLYIPCLATTDNPVKIMLQWGVIRTRGGENNIYNLPYAFPTSGLWAMGCRAANGYSQSMNVSIENRSQIRIQNWAPAGAVEDCCFFAVGYL